MKSIKNVRHRKYCIFQAQQIMKLTCIRTIASILCENMLRSERFSEAEAQGLPENCQLRGTDNHIISQGKQSTIFRTKRRLLFLFKTNPKIYPETNFLSSHFGRLVPVLIFLKFPVTIEYHSGKEDNLARYTQIFQSFLPGNHLPFMFFVPRISGILS